MSNEEALEILKENVKKLISVGDANEYIKKDKKDFLQKWNEVNRYYWYILQNSDGLNDTFLDAVYIVNSMEDDNPSLSEWVELIIDPKIEKKDDSKNIELEEEINELVNKIRNMTHWNPKEVDIIKIKLQDAQDELFLLEDEFEPDKYEQLNNDIDNAMYKIQKFYEMLNSPAMNALRR